MIPEEDKYSNQMSEAFKMLLKNETAFLEDQSEGQGQRNASGAYCYVSQDGNHYIALDFFLMHYKKWLIEKGIVKEV